MQSGGMQPISQSNQKAIPLYTLNDVKGNLLKNFCFRLDGQTEKIFRNKGSLRFFCSARGLTRFPLTGSTCRGGILLYYGQINLVAESMSEYTWRLVQLIGCGPPMTKERSKVILGQCKATLRDHLDLFLCIWMCYDDSVLTCLLMCNKCRI